MKKIETRKYCYGLLCMKKLKNIKNIYTFLKPPIKEPKYNIKNYKRSILQCSNCLHFFAKHKINTTNLYKKNYSTISHGKNIKLKFDKINNLGRKSDNFHRVERFLKFFDKFNQKKIRMVDIGSGMGIFLYNLQKKVKWTLNGLEPDLNFANFCKDNLKLKIINNKFSKKLFKNKKYDIITLNKVTEHIKNPIKFINDINSLLKTNGFIYLEVPDGVAAFNSSEGIRREEFFLDHLHIFSIESLSNLLKKCGFKIIKIKSIIEESGKYTLFAFAKKNIK